MAKYKDTDKLMAILENRCDEADNVEAWLAYAIACKDVRDLPVADAVEVVRCKDCKHSEHWYGDKRRCFLWHEDGIDVFETGYCSYGERKDE